MTLETSGYVENILGALQGDGNVAPAANDGTYSTTASGAAIDSTGVLMTLDTRGKRVLDLALSGTAKASYELEASANGSDWFGPFDSHNDVDRINETYRLGARYIRLRVMTAASAGSTADGFMEAS